MQHTLTAEGYGIRLRPVGMADAAFIVWLRNLEHARGRVGDSAQDVASQENWLKAYFSREGDYYFIIETAGGVSVGAYGIYNFLGATAESGRWVIRPEVPAAIPSAILAFDIAFGTLKLTGLRVATVSTNQGVLSLNRKFGFRQTAVEAGAQLIAGKAVDLVRFEMTAAEWAGPREKLLPLARLAGDQIRDWDRNNRSQTSATQPAKAN